MCESGTCCNNICSATCVTSAPTSAAPTTVAPTTVTATTAAPTTAAPTTTSAAPTTTTAAPTTTTAAPTTTTNNCALEAQAPCAHADYPDMVFGCCKTPYTCTLVTDKVSQCTGTNLPLDATCWDAPISTQPAVSLNYSCISLFDTYTLHITDPNDK